MTRILCWLATFGLVFQALAAVTPGGGGGGGGGPTNGMTGSQVTTAINGLVKPMSTITSNALATGDQSVNTALENWPRMLHRGTNATMLGLGDSTGLYTVSYLRNPIFHQVDYPLKRFLAGHG